MGSRGANPFWFHVLSSTLSHLIALALALLVYLLFLLWRDYVALLLSSFLLAQALHRLRARLVTRIRALRDPTQPPLLRNAARMSYRDLTFSKIPSLLPLAAMLFFLRFDVHARTWMALAGTLAGGLLCAMALVWLLDKRLLAWTRFISDESFVAAVLLGGGAALLLFVGLVVGLGAIFDGLKLAEALFGLIQESVRGDTEWGRWFEESLLEVRNMTLGTLHTSIGEEHFVGRRWLLVAEHFVEEAGAERNGTLLLESTITKMKETFDGEVWLPVLDDVQKLLLWALSADDSVDGAEKSAWELASLVWEQASRAFRESAQGDEPVKELLAQASGYLGYLTPAAGIGAGVGSHALMWTLWAAYKGGYALWFVFSLGLSTIVFITCAFYMLALEVDPLTSLVNTASGDTASEETKQSIRLTVEAAILLPLNSSARNASFTLLLYGVLGVAYPYLATLAAVTLTLFPLTYTWLFCVPWVAGLWLVEGKWLSGCALFFGIAVSFELLRGEAHSMMEAQVGVGDYVSGFALVLGVYMFGVQGVLFGPMIVYGALTLWRLSEPIIQDAANAKPTTQPNHHGRGSPAPAAAPQMGRSVSASGVELSRRTGGGADGGGAGTGGGGGGGAGGADPISRIIRRLSFLSPMPPLSSATDDGEGAADDGAGAGGGQGVRRTATAPAVATHARHIGVRCRAAAVGSGGAAAAAAAVWDAPPVRVRVPPVTSGGGADGAWAELLRGAEDRLQAAGSLPEGHAVVGLQSADGLRVLRFDDLQEGEVLEAMTEVAPPSDNPFAPFSPPAALAVPSSAERASGAWSISPPKSRGSKPTPLTGQQRGSIIHRRGAVIDPEA